ncbi:solute carrier family 22 member 1-like isoform X1 [Lycorma delicatula]|uniref:solute carrier family 22 member 1-like isoform X1 n=1 Tax=Lycorma delicatula TaxID=130591 RepID=UPI003F50F697
MTTTENSANVDDEDIDLYVRKNYEDKTEINEVIEESPDAAQIAMGDIGIWQLWICLYLSFTRFPVIWVQFGFIFFAAQTDYYCVQNSIIQKNKCITDKGQQCTNWDYYNRIFSQTVVSEWDLVCEKEQYINIGQAINLSGLMFGYIFCSAVADKYGRKKPLVIMGVVQFIAGLLAGFSSSFTVFTFLRFIQAVATGGSMTVGFVLLMELLGAKWRSLMSTLAYIPLNIAQFSLVLIAFLTKHWRSFQLALSIPCAFFILYIWIIPESPRWLLAVGREEEALKILEIAAKKNKNPLPQGISVAEQRAKRKSAKNDVKYSLGLKDLCHLHKLLKNTACLSFISFGSGVSFFGLEEYVGHLGGNMYINFLLSASLMIPGMITSVLICEKYGRRHALAIGQLLSGCSCLILAHVVKDVEAVKSWICVSIITVGLFGSGITFPTLHLYSVELFPTVVRNIGVGICCAFGKIGAISAPFINYLNHFHQYFPPLVMGLLSIIASVLCIFLPETKERELPDTLEFEDSKRHLKKTVLTRTIFTVSSGIINTAFEEKQTR